MKTELETWSIVELEALAYRTICHIERMYQLGVTDEPAKKAIQELHNGMKEINAILSIKYAEKAQSTVDVTNNAPGAVSEATEPVKAS